MVGFRRVVAGTDVQEWWDNGADAIAFSRGHRGFVAMSLETTTVTVEAATGLAPGTYCDVLSGGPDGGACTGRAVEVDPEGRVTFDLEFGEAVALHVDALL
jgi:alpha-amylase